MKFNLALFQKNKHTVLRVILEGLAMTIGMPQQKKSRGKWRARNAAAHINPFSSLKNDINRPNTTEGMRWVRQAEIDLEVLQSCQNQASSNHGFAHVCYIAHQVVEKALKGESMHYMSWMAELL